MKKDNYSNLVQSIILNVGRQITELSKKDNSNLVAVAELILKSKGKVIVCGLGKSGLIGQKIVATLCSTGTQSVFLHAADALHGDIGIYKKSDPTILISKSGNTEELIRLIPIIKSMNSIIISIVGNKNSFIAQNSDYILDASITEEIDSLGIVPTTSTVASLVVGDTLAAILMKMRDFKKNDFAKNHPAGDLGKQLGLKVSDVAHPLSKIAVFKPSDTLFHVTSLMTKCPLGASLCLDNKRRILGIITDGDIRKSINNGLNPNDSVESIINFNPVTINESTSLIEAMKIMEDRESQISILPVVDKDDQCIGLLRLHDLFQTKLV